MRKDRTHLSQEVEYFQLTMGNELLGSWDQGLLSPEMAPTPQGDDP